MDGRKEKIPELLQVYPDLKEAIVDFCDNNIGNFNLHTLHAYINKCIEIIMNFDSLFNGCDDHDSSDESSDDGECAMQCRQSVSCSGESLRQKFSNAAKDMTYQRKQKDSKTEKKQDKKLLLKGLISAPQNNSSLRAITSNDQHDSNVDHPTVRGSRGTIEGYPSETNTLLDVSDTEGQPTTVPSNNESSKERILKQHSKKVQIIKDRKCIDVSTVHRWLVALGYTYSEQGKCYYADAHEREDVVRYRIKFVGRYLNAYEVYMKRWIQVSLRDLKAVLKGKEIEIDMQQIGSEEVKSKKIDTYSAVLARGLTYQDENGEEMIELHMDTIVDKAFSDIHFLLQNAVDDDGIYGFNQSVFRPDKTKKVLISIGQDECIFKQFLMLKKAWMSKSGRFRVRPKDDGSGMMISAFQSREFSFGFPLFNKYKNKINEFRRGKKYVDKRAANAVFGTDEKKELDEDPFIRYFVYGNADGKEGYWSYDHMILQLEDVLDVLYAIFGVNMTTFFCLITAADTIK